MHPVSLTSGTSFLTVVTSSRHNHVSRNPATSPASHCQGSHAPVRPLPIHESDPSQSIPRRVRALTPVFLFRAGIQAKSVDSCKAILDPVSIVNNGVSHVLSLRLSPVHIRSLVGVTHCQIYIDDSEDQWLLDGLNAAMEFIEKAMDMGGTVLVHCQEGRSRSASVVIAFSPYARKYRSMLIRKRNDLTVANCSCANGSDETFPSILRRSLVIRPETTTCCESKPGVCGTAQNLGV